MGASDLDLRRPRVADFKRGEEGGSRGAPAPSQASDQTDRRRRLNLSAAEIQSRRLKELCYHCNEKFSPGRHYSLLESSETGEDEPSAMTEEHNLVHLEVTVHSLRSVVVLVDSGDTHNFINQSVARELNLLVENTPDVQVITGTGERVTSTQACRGVSVDIQATTVCDEILILPLTTVDVILDLRWMESRKKVELDFENYMRLLFSGPFLEAVGLPPPREVDHKIPFAPATMPINVHPLRYPHIHKSEIEMLIWEMMVEGLIQHLNIPFSSPTLAQVFLKLDLHLGYHQIRVNAEDVPKTAFQTHEGHYEFLVMPFRLSNAPATFQALMNKIFSKFLRRFVLIFFGDILIYYRNRCEHEEHLRHVFTILEEHHLHLNPKNAHMECIRSLI
ncbi:unnamed protein product [Spirodela intermedia]|uniref:Reverse transcriptase domain-containing protein n=1 Tax=Spirodela intermedia TaxID=51605 RepID=A0A7I8IC15_SPIIN|nr:unnamed protein product [Spirodela intermedia]CAA6654421.1 unnamed protein product [Spirodela intermedia]